MKIIVVDDEKLALEVCVEAVQKACDIMGIESEIFSFNKPAEAMDFLKEHRCEVAFVDIEMPVYNGIEVAKSMKYIYPNINIIFQTSYGKYREDAFSLHASGYLSKPVMAEDVVEELRDLRHPVQLSHRGLKIRTFGSFEIFYDGVPLEINAKSKELLAYMIDRYGASVSNNEMYAILYGVEEGHSENLKKIKKSLVDKLTEIGCADIIIQQWGKMSVNVDKLDCDYFDWKKGDVEAINQFHGEYMSQYIWADLYRKN